MRPSTRKKVNDRVVVTAPYLSSIQVANSLGISRQRVLALIQAGRLPAQKVGRDWLISPRDLERVRVRRPGRPRSRPSKKSDERRAVRTKA